MTSKWKRAIRKGHACFSLVFLFWYLKLVLINSALNSASGKLTEVLKQYRKGTEKTIQIWKSGLKFSEISFVIYSPKTRKYLNQHCFTGSWPRIVWKKQYLSNFDSTPLTCDRALFPGKNIPNIAKLNRIFPGKRRWDKYFILTYLDSSMAEVFPHWCLFFFDFGYLQEEKMGQSWTKSPNIGSFPFQ